MTNPKVAKALESAARFCAAWFRHDVSRQPWLILGGQAGCGKTTISERCLKWMRGHNTDAGHQWSPWLWDWSYVAGMERAEWEKVSRDGIEASCLIVDDLGAEFDRFKTGEPVARLRSIIEQRANRFTLFTTNVLRREWESVWDARVADRLNTAAFVNMFDVPSFRATGGKA